MTKNSVHPKLSVFLTNVSTPSKKNSLILKKEEHDSLTEKEEYDSLTDGKVHELKKKKLENDGREIDNLLKKLYGWAVFGVLVTWVVFVIYFMLWSDHECSDGVTIALITTTSINILGLPIVILKYLFSGK